MQSKEYREIPYNFTSADDRLIVNELFGPEVWESLQALRGQRMTGRSARLMMRFIGDLFILHRNPFLAQELMDSSRRRLFFFNTMLKDLELIEQTARASSASDPERSSKVLALVSLCRKKAKTLHDGLSGALKRRILIRKRLATIIDADEICFDPFALISHATDATDWRLHLPLAVVRPSREEQLAPLLKAIAELGLYAIPRGGGTGLTGGAVPLAADCVMINSEKLNRIHGIREIRQQDGSLIPVLALEAGVITQDAMRYAEERGFVFATDPTSAWASTIGGNIAENAGGKTAVLWGTAIDNLYSFSMAMPEQGQVTVRRRGHPMRKIMPEDRLFFDVVDADGNLLRSIELHSDAIRKKGLWKDITNKALGGLPGVQKEGVDGVIGSAEFVLHRPYPKKLTCCLEFFGDDMDEASRVIVALSEAFVNQGEEALMALEHFDEEYIRAINYKFKAARSIPPKAVLLIDMVAHTSEQILRGKKNLLALLVAYPNTEVFTASDSDEAARFWRDRKRLGAIAARTNAFKLNEDIVLPLSALAEFARYIDACNQEEDACNQESIVQAIMHYLAHAEPIEDPDWLEAKLPKANELCQQALAQLTSRTKAAVHQELALKQLIDDLLELFRGFPRISATIRHIHADLRAKRIIIATHMHAGDGNVHVNIPVFSNDRVMMRRAEERAEAVMRKAIALEGVVSGEHGIGVTKIKFLEPSRIEELRQYRRQVDPKGVMNPGKLDDPGVIGRVFTPSFNLLSLEARILQHNSLETLSASIAQCIRCGKCKPDCCVFYPGGNLFFHPRNKNLAIGSLIEALLYDMQRSHFPRFKQLKYLEQVADHCTLCGKCLPPCPVDIDTAQVSILERQILVERGYKHSPPQTRLSLHYLKTRNRAFNQAFRSLVLQGGSAAQRLASSLFSRLPPWLRHKKWRPLLLLHSPMAKPSAATLRQSLPVTNLNQALLFSPAQGLGKTVFYFPGCGSERLYADIGLASLYILLKSGVRVVLPPAHLCCGFPARANAKDKMHADVTLRDTIILSQIREMLGYLLFDAVVVSCGTCREALHELGVEAVFNANLADVAAFVLEARPSFKTEQGQQLLYHRPCHDSLQGEGVRLLRFLGHEAHSSPHCCSEAGTLSLSRPDITQAMLQRKAEAIEAQRQEERLIVTNCPSCLTGLGRNRHKGAQACHLAVLLAQELGGDDWRIEAKALLAQGEPVAF